LRSIYENPSENNNFETCKEHLRLIYVFIKNFNLNEFTMSNK